MDGQAGGPCGAPIVPRQFSAPQLLLDSNSVSRAIKYFGHCAVYCCASTCVLCRCRKPAQLQDDAQVIACFVQAAVNAQTVSGLRSTDATWLQAAIRPHFTLVCTQGCPCGSPGAAEGGVQRCWKCDNGRQPAEQREECCEALFEAAFPEHACYAAVSICYFCCQDDPLPEARLSKEMLIMQKGALHTALCHRGA